MSKKEVGHTFLARLGKKRLRPGGKNATEWLIKEANLSSDSNVLEVACNMGTTMIDIVKRFNCHVIGIDLDKAALDKATINITKHGLESHITVLQANAMKLPFPDNHFDVVINEAMLTMLQNSAKEKAIAEYYRVLKPGGCLLTHDVMLTKRDDAVVEQLRKVININVQPLTKKDWTVTFENHFNATNNISGPMTLLSPKGMIKDEGFAGTFKIFRNAMKKENRPMFVQMFHTFKTKKDTLHFIAVCSRKY